MSVVFGTTLHLENEDLSAVAALLAKRMDMPLRLVHVCEDPRAPLVLGTDQEYVLGSVRDDLDHLADQLREAFSIDVRPHLASGSVVSTLTSLSEFELATVVLIGSTSRSLRFTAERLARSSRVPVIVVREPGRLRAWLRGERPLRILVGADLDRASEAARAFASKLAMLGSTDIEVLLVASPDKAHERLGIESPAEDGTLVPEAEAILLRELSLSAPNNESSASLRVLSAHGGADAHLVARCDQGNFDLLVVGQRNRSIAQLVRRGSIMRGVLRASPVSVASVPIPIGETDLSVRHPHVVVVGMQLTDSDHRALRHAVAYAEAGASVHLVHVVEATRTDADLRDARDEAWYQLSKAAHETNDGSFSIEPHVVVGQPAEQLLTVAGRVGADLLVLGARRRPFVSRSLLGSVTQALVQDAPIPLLIVPARRP